MEIKSPHRQLLDLEHRKGRIHTQLKKLEKLMSQAYEERDTGGGTEALNANIRLLVTTIAEARHALIDIESSIIAVSEYINRLKN